MNKADKEVLQYQLDQEKAVLKRLESHYRSALNDIINKTKVLQADIDMLQAAGASDDKALSMARSKVYQLQYQKTLQKQIEGILDKLHSDEYSTLQQFVNGAYEDGYLGTMYSINQQGIPIIVPIDQSAMVKAIQLDSKIKGDMYEALGVDVADLKKVIQAEISRGISTSLSYADIARNISNAANAPLSRAKTIARTESHRIQQASADDARKASKDKGADVVKQWDSTMDGSTRPTHRELDGQIKEVDEPFKIGGKKAMYPGDFGDPAEDCNCRCVALTRARWGLDEAELETLKQRAEFFGLDKTENFEDYKKKYLKAAQETEKQFGVMYGEKARDVDFDYIGSEEYRAKIATLTTDQEVNNSIYTTAQKILKHCDGTDHEDMYLINANDGTVFAQVTDTAKKSGIVYTDEFVEKLKESAEKNIPIIAMHNHPQGTPPSSDDFRKAFDNGYSFGVVLGHNGQLYRYETPKEAISKELANTMAEDIDFLYRQGYDIDRACQLVYNGYGISYTIVEGGVA